MYESDQGREVANAVRATRHLDDRTIAAVAAYRGILSADAKTKPYRRGARRLIRRVRRGAERALGRAD
jgi:hypothetical protein